jgi:hypothetical protein
MNDSEFVSNYFATLVDEVNSHSGGRANNLLEHDQIIFYVISTRCEIDMSGFKSVFEQLLTESEILVLIDGLKKLDAVDLAELFYKAYTRLKDINYFDSRDWIGEKFLEDVEQELSKNDGLWEIDPQMAALIRRHS